MSRKLVIVLGIVMLTLAFAGTAGAEGFVHGVVIDVDGEEYYMAGVPDAPNGATDIRALLECGRT